MNFVMLPVFAWSYAVRAFGAVWLAFERLLIATGMKNYYLAAIGFAIAFRLLVAPLIGREISGASDQHKKKIPTSKGRRTDGGE